LAGERVAEGRERASFHAERIDADFLAMGHGQASSRVPSSPSSSSAAASECVDTHA
jgi:hypothetical protein